MPCLKLNEAKNISGYRNQSHFGSSHLAQVTIFMFLVCCFKVLKGVVAFFPIMANCDALISEVEELLASQLDTIVNGLVKVVKKKLVEKLTPVLADRVKRGLVEESARALNASTCSSLSGSSPSKIVKSHRAGHLVHSKKRMCLRNEPISEPMVLQGVVNCNPNVIA